MGMVTASFYYIFSDVLDVKNTGAKFQKKWINYFFFDGITLIPQNCSY